MSSPASSVFEPIESDPQRLPFLSGGGELGARIRAFDWERVGLGRPHTWPTSLRTCVRIILTSRQPMFVWWGPNLINLYNDAYKAIVGGKHPEALGQPASVVWREIWNEVEPRATSALRDNAGTYDEALLLIMERNGYREETYYTFSYSPVPNDDGVTGGLICANTDDTQRIIGQRQIKLLGELAARGVESRSVQEACGQVAVTLARAERDLPFALIYLVDAERGEAVLAGQSGIEPGQLASPERMKLEDEAPWPIRQALARQEPQVVEDLARRFSDLPTGAWHEPPRVAAIVPIPASGGAGTAALLIAGLNPFRLFDEGYSRFLNLVAGQISSSIANAEAYERERQRAESLAELDRAKTAFFSNVSHEFRTPLTLMLGPIEDALRTPERSLSGENLETAYRSSLRLLKLVNSLLDFSRIEAGRAQASFEPTDLAALTTDLASAFRSAIERAGLGFVVDCPPLGEPVYVDHDMWEKIVLNLISNALKYTFDGSIQVSLLRREANAELTVKDTGTGIPESELPHIFERFHRVKGARSRTHEGSGIGLALVHELVRLHGGQVDAESGVDLGTTFRVRVPLGHQHLPRERVTAPRTLASTATGAAPYVQEAFRWLPGEVAPKSLQVGELVSTVSAPTNVGRDDRPAHILVADDNADMRDYVVRLLRERWQVTAVSDGAEALASARQQPPDLVLTDVMMPELDGFGLLRALRTEPLTRDLPVLMLSARAGDEARSEGLEAGADDYLVKPFSARELLARVATHLQLARLRREAQRERQRLHDIFVQAPAPVAVLSGPELRFEVANASFCAMVGRENLVGLALREAFFEPQALEAIAAVEQAYLTGTTLHVNEQAVQLQRNGKMSQGYFSYVVQPIFEAGTQPAGIIVVANEVTESVLARQRVDGLRSAAERANRAKDEFLSTLSHELRTPLNAIVGWAHLLRTGSVPAEQQQRALETVERNARLQARLVEDMLDLSRIEQGKLVLSVGPLEMVRVVEAAIESLRPAAEAKQIRLQPVLDSHATIVGDADRLQQVVWNLLSNAIKFTPKGGRVQVRLRRERSFVEVAVADTGEGIDPAFLPHIFDRFRQGNQTITRHAGGLGLGLAIVRSLVELHGGEVSAHSDGKNQGATLIVRLPVAPLRAEPPGEREQSAPRLREPTGFECPDALGGLAVLVVDDESETRALLQFVIEQCSARVTTASSAAEGLALLESQHFDLLISDVGMPGEDGYSFVRRVRALPEPKRSVPALALTAYARVEDRTAALRAGFNMHLAKPIDPGELLVVLETLIRNAAR
ncbi:MAG TPA: ATP-binding protein [Polyangiaceae bacterium]|nr:ATP-binding protein [Polyangiaceae bacterium]